MKSGSVWYEQWPESVVDALPVFERDRVPRDGRWHVSEPVHTHLAYREVRFAHNGIAQAMSSDRLTPLFEGLRAVEPPQIEDDADWVVSSSDGNDGICYTLASHFAVTHGPFAWQVRFDDILAPYGLGIEPRMLYTRGESHFSALETDCFADAVQRLAWLESFFVKVNGSVEATCFSAWEWLAGQLTLHVAEAEEDPGETVDPPKIFELMTSKTIKRQVPGQRPVVPRIDGDWGIRATRGWPVPR